MLGEKLLHQKSCLYMISSQSALVFGNHKIHQSFFTGFEKSLQVRSVCIQSCITIVLKHIHHLPAL